jgi:hypothetical protein
LLIDASLGDARSAASDWLNYGQFLRRAGQPERLVFACLLHAEELLRGSSGDELSAIQQARQQSEARIGKEAASMRRSAAATAQQAASLSPTSFSTPN